MAYRCDHCGHVGYDVQTSARWIGGVGHVIVHWCVDQTGCFARAAQVAR